jgi:hypothetical protein
MAYAKNMSAAAHRHYLDACKLQDAKRFDNAGYHFGFAAECAVKQKLIEAGVLQGDDAIWSHWPDLKRFALMAISGRQAAPIRSLLDNGNFMQYWDIVMRYAENASVNEAQAQRWREQANSALGMLV